VKPTFSSFRAKTRSAMAPDIHPAQAASLITAAARLDRQP
jgi:hypothetical protein